MSFQLILFITFCIVFILLSTAFYIWGSINAIRMLRATFETEKLAKRYKLAMYIICILTSWVAYSALSRLQNSDEENE